MRLFRHPEIVAQVKASEKIKAMGGYSHVFFFFLILFLFFHYARKSGQCIMEYENVCIIPSRRGEDARHFQLS